MINFILGAFFGGFFVFIALGLLIVNGANGDDEDL